MATTTRTSKANGGGNGAEQAIDLTIPYTATVTIEGTRALMFHRYDPEAVEERANAAPGSKIKKEKNPEEYVYRCENGNLGLPGGNLYAAVCGPKGAAKWLPNPKAGGRGSAHETYKAGVSVLTEMADLGCAGWDALDHRRAVIGGRSAVTAIRPYLLPGWRATYELACLVPEYIGPQDLHRALTLAGRLIGLGANRPTYGRFVIVNYDWREEEGL